MKNLLEAMQNLKESKSKVELREFAKDILQNAIGTAYYKLENYEKEFTEEEIETINKYLDISGRRACKAFGREYITY